MNKNNDDLAQFFKIVDFYRSKKGLHDVFGVVLFTSQHWAVVKVLKDSEIRRALDKISGPRLVIFAIRPKKSAKRNTRLNFLDEFCLADIPWGDVDDNQTLLETFAVSDLSNPLVLFFTKLPSGDMLQLRWPFTARNEDECISNLESIFARAAEAVSKVQANNIKSNQEVFNLLRNERINFITLRAVRKGITLFEKLKSLAG